MQMSKRAGRFSVRFGLALALIGSLIGGAVAGNGGYAPPYSELVVDARTGKTIYALNADAPRHPASITKVMTLYLLFEQLDAGKISLSTPIKISNWAARQAPSKLGLSPGDTIPVEDAIKAVVTKSANDIAVAIAESIGGTEADFADMMTKKARSIGMTRTVYANASGLPNPRQITTARDLVTLGRSIQARFPRYFQYFSLRSFDYDGGAIANHNKLLGKVDGVDGIKTGYTAKSGFNLLTSVHSEGRSLLAVILGGRSGGSRDRRMADLIDTYLEVASNGDGKPTLASNKKIAPPPLPTEVDRTAPNGEDDGDTPTASLTPAKSAVTASSTAPASTPVVAANTAPNSNAAPAPVLPQQGKLIWKPGAQPAAAPKALGYADAADTAGSNGSSSKERAWWIQVGVTASEKQARSLLADVSDQADALISKAKPSVEKVKVKGRDMWRSRFTSMTLDDAQAVCAKVKKQGGACFASRS